MNLYLILVIVLLLLVIITVLTSIYIRWYNNPDMIFAFYVALVTISQFMATRLTPFDFGRGVVFTTTAASIIFPFTFQLTDQTNEFFGRNMTHKMIFTAFFTQVFVVVVSYLATQMVQVNDNFSAEAYNVIFYSSIRITLASWVAFLISENTDAVIYQMFKKWTKGRFLWMRNIFSDVLSLALDSLVFVPLAFAGELPWFGEFSIFSVFVGQISVKWVFGLADTPTIYLSRWIIRRGGNQVVAQ
jgi:uncharacterized integral membrane protein (TIGR00697 family)